MALKMSYEEKLAAKKASGSMMRLTDYLFSNPLITVPRAAGYLGVTYPPAKNAIENLQKMGILIEQNDKERGKMFVAHEIMAILS